MWSLMTDVCRAMGVRTDVPFCELTEEEKAIVYDGPAVKKHILYRPKNGEQAGELDFTYYSAVHTVENALAKVKDEKGMKRVEKFLKQDTCPDCGGTRLCASARQPKVRGISLDEACQMTLSALVKWVAGVPETLPAVMRPMAESICGSFAGAATRLMELGLGYLALDRAAATLSTGERQRMQLARARAQPHHGGAIRAGRALHRAASRQHRRPHGGDARSGGGRQFRATGGSRYADTRRSRPSGGDGPPARARTAGASSRRERWRSWPQTPPPASGRFCAGRTRRGLRERTRGEELFALGRLRLATGAIHTVQPLEVEFPKGRLSVVTGVSGSGKTTLILESLIPALEASIAGRRLPKHVRAVEAPGISQIKLIDATPIGINVRSTVATYANVHDELRKIFARTAEARHLGYKAGDFSYNTGRLRCPTCDGTGIISLDVQFLPDVDIPCPRLPRLALRQGRGARAL